MKFKTSLFILLIGMISFTSLATTPMMEQKPEATVVKVMNLDEVVVVVNENVDFVQALNELTEAFKTLNVTLKDFNPNTLAIINDVGWNLSYKQTTMITYKEKLLENFNLHFKDKLLFTDTLVRDNC